MGTRAVVNTDGVRLIWKTRRWQQLSLRERIATRIAIQPSGCWNWQGDRTSRDGYGRLYIGGRLQLVHRVAYECYVAPIPLGLLVLHQCDNPACCNPSHLFVGTQSDNVQDALAKQCHVAPAGEINGLAKLTKEAVMVIRETAYRTATITELARRFGVSRRAIRLAVTGATWTH